jgi:hypothetical protein
MHLIALFFKKLLIWCIFFEIFAGCMRIPDAWILSNWEFTVVYLTLATSTGQRQVPNFKDVIMCCLLMAVTSQVVVIMEQC